MRILGLNYEYPPLGGGGGIAHREVARVLSTRHEVAMVTTHFRGLPTFEQDEGIRVYRVPVWGRTERASATLRSMLTFPFGALRVGRRLIREFRPDILHAFFAVPSGLPAVLLSRWMDVPVVLTIVGGDVYDPDPTAGFATHQHPAVRAVVRWVIRRADQVTAISRDTKRRAREYHGAAEDLEVIPLGHRLLHLRPLPRQAPANRPLKLVTIGRLIPRKAHADLLRAMAALPPETAKLHLIGEGPLDGRLRALAEQLQIADRVTFHGGVDEPTKWRLLEEADCFVSASLHEGFGLVFLEAMAYGLPIICTDVGGHADFLTAGENALFVPVHQPEQLAAGTRWLAAHPGEYERMSRANLDKAPAYGVEAVATAYERLFARVLERKRGQEPFPRGCLKEKVPDPVVVSRLHEPGRH